jgi:A/G-specific adenine glycosylase
MPAGGAGKSGSGVLEGEIDPRRVERIRRKLVAWYRTEARDLPWRRTSDPYAILVSEVMLQQTRVETVIPYFERFMRQFPTIDSLARASVDDVLRAWEGLGYYRRAQNLHRTAKRIAESHEGTVPRTAKELLRLPGIGAYTAAAVASIAYGGDDFVVDGNVARVLSRLFLVRGEPTRALTKKRLRGLAENLMDRTDPSASNQGLMDLGARICVPKKPACAACPVCAECDAHHLGLQAEVPLRRTRRSLPHIDVVAGIVWENAIGGRFLIAQRKADDMLGGMWEFPGGRVEPGETREAALARELSEELAIDVDVAAPFLEIDHAYSHFRMTLYVYHCYLRSGSPRAVDCADWAWVGTEDLEGYALSAADRQVATALSRGER